MQLSPDTRNKYVTDTVLNARNCCILQMYGDGWYESSMEGAIFHWTSHIEENQHKKHKNFNVYNKWNAFLI